MMVNYRELVNILDEYMGKKGTSYMTRLQTGVPDRYESCKDYVKKSEYRRSKWQLVVWDRDIGYPICHIDRYVPINGGTVKYNSTQVYYKMYWGS